MTMKGNHTPGPWVVGVVTGGWDAVFEKGHRTVPICEIKLNNPHNPPLIAAAPEMLEALEGIDRSFTNLRIKLRTSEEITILNRLGADICLVRIAIKKAKG